MRARPSETQITRLFSAFGVFGSRSPFEPSRSFISGALKRGFGYAPRYSATDN